MGARLSRAERALLLLGLLRSQSLVLELFLLPAALLLVWLYFWVGSMAARPWERVERTQDASRAVRRLEAKLQYRAARQAMTRRRWGHGTGRSWIDHVLGLLAAAVVVGIAACVLIVLKGVAFLVVAGSTLWL